MFAAACEVSPSWEAQPCSLHTGSALGEQDGGLIGAEEKVINSKKKVDENMVSISLCCHAHVNAENNERCFPDEAPCVRFHRLAGGWATAAPTNAPCCLVFGYEKEQRIIFQQ